MGRRERRGVELDGRRAEGVTVSRQDEIVLHFDYAQIAAARRRFVQEMAAGVKGRLGNMARGALEVGAMLNAIRDDFPHGTWQPFLMQEYGFKSPRQPQRWMQAAARLGGRLEEFVGLPDTVLGLLAGATDEVIEQVAERVATGRAVGVAEVRLLVDRGAQGSKSRVQGPGSSVQGPGSSVQGPESEQVGEHSQADELCEVEPHRWEVVGEEAVDEGAAAAQVSGDGAVSSQQLLMFAEEPAPDWEALGWAFVHNEAGWHGLHRAQGVATDTWGTRAEVVHKLQVGAFGSAFFEVQQSGGVVKTGRNELTVEPRYGVKLPEWVVVKLRLAAETGELDEALTRPGVQVLLGALGEVEE